MGRGRLRGAGIVLGVAANLVPGVGTVVGAVILSGTTSAGSIGDHLIDKAKAKKEAEELQKAQENERAKIKKEADDKLEQERLQQEQKIKAEQERLKKEQDERAEKLKAEQEQNNLVTQVLAACRKGQLDSVPTLLQKMDKDHFYNVLGSRPLAECSNADVREQVQKILAAEEERREPAPTACVASGPQVRM